MSLAQGREYLAIPGPSTVPERVLNAMHRAAPNIYEGELHEVTASLLPDLRRLAGTRGQVAMYIANGHGAWEAAVSNVFAPGDTALVVATGPFAHGWAAVAGRMGVECRILDFGKRSTYDPARVEEALAADRDHRIKALVAVHVDTGTSVLNDVPALRAALDRAGHPALLLIDCMASLGCDRFEMDAWGVDVMVAGSQKGLMTPPGMAFVWFNDRAAARQSANVSHYWNWTPRAEPDEYWQYWDGTAPTHHVYGLRAALDMIGEEGLENVWRRHDRLAHAYWAAFETWGQGGPVELNIAQAGHRSRAVTAVRAGTGNGTALRDWISRNMGATLGIGLGLALSSEPEWHDFFRVGHMGHVNAHMVLGVIGSIEAGLQALQIPHGRGGLQAAIDSLA